MAEVSVIVPTYNAAPYLRECVGSIVAQTFGDLEVICVDDASTDGSLAILGELSREHGEVRVLPLDGCLGVSAARNAGLDAATGDYVLFVDADDAVDATLVEKALAQARSSRADMTIYGFFEWHPRTGALVPREMCEELRDVAPFSLDDLRGPSTALVTPNVWRILFRRDFLEGNGLRFHEDLQTSEDLAFIYEALLCRPALALLDERLYRYRRDGGTTLTRARRGDAGYRALAHVFDFGRRRDLLDGCAMRHLVNIVLDVAEYAMRSAADVEEYRLLYDGFRRDWLGVVLPHEGEVAERYLPFLEDVRSTDDLGHLFSLYAGERAALEAATARCAALESELRDARDETAAVRGSHSYRVGNALMRLPSAARDALRRRGKGEGA